jgi:hypothetical protein
LAGSFAEPGQLHLLSSADALKNCIDSTQTADTPRCAAASVTTAAPKNATATAKKNAQAAATATTAASAATAATSTATAKTTTSTASATTMAPATTMASTAAAAARHLREGAGVVFPVEEVECRKTHVGHFLFAKNEALIGCGV